MSLSIFKYRNKKSAPSHLLGRGGWALVLGVVFVFPQCSSRQEAEPPEFRLSSKIALSWNRLSLELERHTPGYRAPVSARMFGYLEMAAYEASLPGLSDYVSLGNFLPEYESFAEKYAGEKFCLPASLNAAYAAELRYFFASAPAHFFREIDRLERENAEAIRAEFADSEIEKSAAYGKKIATAVWRWAETDRVGQEGFLHNFEPISAPARCRGCWQAPTDSNALLPNWERVRPFVPEVLEIPVKKPIEFAVTPGSEFYTEAMEVYSVSQPLSKENIWIAEFWSDDLPGLTLSSSGRWISIANQAFDKKPPSFPVLMETYLKLAWALSDAGILVWRGKYEHRVLRPDTYIRQHINPDWSPLHETPPFPAYPSGHAAFGAAAAEILGAALGTQFELLDRTHENRPEFAGTPRHFRSFEEMAQENATSRVLLGVHFRMDCEEGLRLGKLIGQKIQSLPLRRKGAAMMRKPGN